MKTQIKIKTKRDASAYLLVFMRLFAVVALGFAFLPNMSLLKAIKRLTGSTGFLFDSEMFNTTYAGTAINGATDTLFTLAGYLFLAGTIVTFIGAAVSFAKGRLKHIGVMITAVSSFVAFAGTILYTGAYMCVCNVEKKEEIPFLVVMALLLTGAIFWMSTWLTFNMNKKGNFSYTTTEVIFNIVNYSVFILFAIICIFPFYYLFINTISDNDLVSSGSILFYPRGLHLNNYKALLTSSDIWQAFKISVGRTLIGTALMVGASGLVGYLVTKQEMWGRKFWYRFILITMYFNAGLIPWYLNMLTLGLTDNFLAYIIPSIVAPYNIILVKTYVESIPAELEESAKMDGASYFKVFLRIIWPLSKPILATIAIFGAVGQWNSFTDSMILMSGRPDLYSLQYKLHIYLSTSSNIGAIAADSDVSELVKSLMNAKSLKYTVAMITIIPIVMVYPFLQGYFEKGIMLGAVKG